ADEQNVFHTAHRYDSRDVPQKPCGPSAVLASIIREIPQPGLRHRAEAEAPFIRVHPLNQRDDTRLGVSDAVDEFQSLLHAVFDEAFSLRRILLIIDGSVTRDVPGWVELSDNVEFSPEMVVDDSQIGNGRCRYDRNTPAKDRRILTLSHESFRQVNIQHDPVDRPHSIKKLEMFPLRLDTGDDTGRWNRVAHVRDNMRDGHSDMPEGLADARWVRLPYAGLV